MPTCIFLLVQIRDSASTDKRIEKIVGTDSVQCTDQRIVTNQRLGTDNSPTGIRIVFVHLAFDTYSCA